ncbi:hypothetical protein [Actinopolymorpha pittospori]|uniref:Nucleic acid-binding Zn-ribbon protein n=1 Tax=Actinopolymorpha pittospori TaxID=648752 RepID=A0A927MZ03_9ACTN|nr:hypothetical protein [Actinopolymorpha pittospori]MBE1609146.1 putative nucleic acid-binding Zn-ribbon protein [Actinopolymorpha pittospori]
MTDPSRLAQIEADLAAAAELRRRHSDLTQRLTTERAQLKLVEERVRTLRGHLIDEAKDVEVLESFSPTRIWATLRGSRADDLARERAEHEAARYAVAEAEARRDAVSRDVESLQAQVEGLGDVDDVQRRAVAAKEQWALANDPVVAAALEDIARERGRLTASRKEAAEAYAAGEPALALVEQAVQLLGSAESWSTADTFFGGGVLTDMMKYEKMDEAADVLHRADVALGRFSRELADVGVDGIDSVQVDTMTRTFDMYFDNIFTDMAVRSRIQDAGRKAGAARQAVRQALLGLEKTSQDIAGQLAQLEEKRSWLLSG